MEDEENRIARNSEVLNKTEAEIATLETQFVSSMKRSVCTAKLKKQKRMKPLF